VKASTRSDFRREELESVGVKSFIVDIDCLNDDVQAFLAADILIISITSKNIVSYKRLLSQLEKSTVRSIIFISSTSVYLSANEIVTEDSLVDTDHPLIAIENLFISNSSFNTTVVRFGGLFGYSRKPGNFFKSGKVVADPDNYVNMIHRDDCIQIIDNIITRKSWNQIFNACADGHPTKRDFYTKSAMDIGASPPNFSDSGKSPYKIVSSAKLKKMLGIEFLYNDLLNLPVE